MGFRRSFGIILLLAMTAAACWYYLEGSKTKRAPGSPHSSSRDYIVTHSSTS